MMINNANCIFALTGTNRFNVLDAEEKDTYYLSNGYLKDASFSLCKKIITSKPKLTDKESESETICNKKWLMFSFENYQTFKEMPCSFCMGYDYYAGISTNGR